MYCPNCGAQSEDGMAFCVRCGTKLNPDPAPAQAAAPPPAPQDVPPPPPQSAPAPPVTPQPMYRVEGQPTPDTATQFKRLLKKMPFTGWLYVLIMVLILACGVAGGIGSLLIMLLIDAALYFLLMRQYWLAVGFGTEFTVRLPEGRTDAEWAKLIVDEFDYPEDIDKISLSENSVLLRFLKPLVPLGEAYGVKVTVQDGVLKTEADTPIGRCDATTFLAAAYAANELAQALNYFANGIVLPADFMMRQKAGHKDTLGKVKTIVLQCVMLVLALIVVWLVFFNHDKSLGIKDSKLNDVDSDMTVGEALDSFYTDGKWSNYKDDGTQYVVYKARQEKYDMDMEVTFWVQDSGDFGLQDSEINGEQTGAYGAALLVAAAYGDGPSKIWLASSYADNWTAWDEAFSVAQEESERQDAAESAAASSEAESYAEPPADTGAGDYGTHDYTYDDTPYSDEEFANGLLNYGYQYDDNNVIIPYSADAWTIVVTTGYALKSGPGVNYDDVAWVNEGDKLYGHYGDGDWVFVADYDFNVYGWIPEPYQEFDWSTVQ